MQCLNNISIKILQILGTLNSLFTASNFFMLEFRILFETLLLFGFKTIVTCC